MVLDGFGKFLVIFVQKYIFLPLLQKFWAKKWLFGDFPTWPVIPREIPFLEVYTFICYDKNNFHKKLQFCEGGTILFGCHHIWLKHERKSFVSFLKNLTWAPMPH